MQSWDQIRAFLALHRAGTFDGAAQLLKVNDSTLRRQIHALEAQLGSSLFTRQRGVYRLIATMNPLLDAALRMEACARTFLEGLEDPGIGGIRLTTLDFVAAWLAPDLALFRELHPLIKLEVGTEQHFVDLERDMVDIAIRMARPTRGDSRLRKLGELEYGIFASPDYIARHGGGDPAALHDLLTLKTHFIHQDHDFIEGESQWMLERLPKGRIVSSTDSYFVLRELCEAGMGLALIPRILGDASTSLKRLECQMPAMCDVWSVVHADTGSTPRVRLFLGFIRDVFRSRLAMQRPPARTFATTARGRTAMPKPHQVEDVPPPAASAFTSTKS